MSWYKSGSDTFGFRTGVAVDGTGLAPGITEVNVTVTIPSDHSRFWDNVQSDGDDVRFTQSDGMTVLAYERTTWDYANRSALFKVTAFTVGLAANMGNLWMFFGNSTIASGSTAYGGGTLYTGRIITSGPTISDLVVEPGSVSGETSARYDLQKTPAESVFVWVRPVLTTRDVLFNGYFYAEEVQFVTIGADDAKVTATMPNMRLFTDSQGFALIRVLISGGADTETDTVRITVTTTNGRIGQALIDVVVKTL